MPCCLLDVADHVGELRGELALGPADPADQGLGIRDPRAALVGLGLDVTEQVRQPDRGLGGDQIVAPRDALAIRALERRRRGRDPP